MTEPELVRLLDQFDRVVSAAGVHAPTAITIPLAKIAQQLRMRRAYNGTARLVGLAGGTGSGKSSLLNALAGEEVSYVGSFRPTTARALAWVPSIEAARLERLWDRIGVEQVVTHNEPHNVALVDLPDVDSIEESHKQVADALLPILDLVLWVVDPEKYRDRVLHEDYLRPLAGHQRRFRFVLNQIDRLAPSEIEEILSDLVAALREDGFLEPVVWVAAADPQFGPPSGIEEIWSAINSTLDALDSGQDRTLAELERGIRLVQPLATPLGVTERWGEIKAEAARLFTIGSTDDAWRLLRTLVQDLASGAPEIDASIELPALVGAVSGNAADISRRLDVTLGRFLRDAIRPRAATNALLIELSLELARARG